MKKQKSHYSEPDVFVADTHALLWHLTEDKRLGKKAREILDRADRGEVDIVIPTTVLAEALFITEKHKVDLKFMDIIEDIKKSWGGMVKLIISQHESDFRHSDYFERQ